MKDRIGLDWSGGSGAEWSGADWTGLSKRETARLGWERIGLICWSARGLLGGLRSMGWAGLRWLRCLAY